MRVSDLQDLPANSPLATRIRKALARDQAEKSARTTLQHDAKPTQLNAEGNPTAFGCQSAAKGENAASAQIQAVCKHSSAVVQEHLAREEDLHRAIVGMLVVEMRAGVIFMHPANGGYRSKAEAGRLKAMGVVAGAPDLLVIVDGRVHGLEIKTEKGRVSPAQKVMAERFAQAGAPFEVVRSVADARAVLRRWGAIPGGAE
jgi:hypothetical protein